MRRLIIENIGAIKHIDLELNRINVFIGPQSSGKSTVSKILCYCMWVEKHCYLNENEIKRFKDPLVFYKNLTEYHRIDGYFNEDSVIKYYGEYMNISYTYTGDKVKIIRKHNSQYSYPKISYIPSERNLVATIPNFGKYNGNDVITYFGYDWKDAKMSISDLNLSNILERRINYKYENDEDYIIDNGKKLLLRNGSSGVLSLVPLYLTISYMFKGIYDKKKMPTPDQRSIIARYSDQIYYNRNALAHQIDASSTDAKIMTALISLLSMITLPKYQKTIAAINKILADGFDSLSHSKINNIIKDLESSIYDIEHIFDYKYTQLFIEEPEQNLFPKAQKRFIYELLNLIVNSDECHCAIITTHSPYILYALNNCMMGGLVGDKMPQEEKEELDSYNRKAWIEPKCVSLWQIKDGEMSSFENNKTGTIGNHYFNDVTSDTMSEYYDMLMYLNDEE